VIQTILTSEIQQKTLLEEIGIHEKFEQTNLRESKIAKLTFSSEIPLANDYILQTADLIAIERDEAKSTGLFLSNYDNGQYSPVGYIVYVWSKEDPNKVTTSINYFKTRPFKSLNEGLPETINGVVWSSNAFDAFKIQPEYQGAGLGKSLWLVGAAYMESRGIKNIEISGDLTIGQKSGTESFYTKAGAVVTDDGTEIYETSKVWDYREDIENIFNV
jgi:hypothetical protein